MIPVKTSAAKKPRKPNIDREGIQQSHFFNWLKFAYPEVYDHAFHVPNGGRRDGKTGAKLKREGVKAGVPDIVVATSKGHWHGLFIEFKAARPHSASVSTEQKQWIERLSRAGYLAVVCRGLEEAKKAIEDYLMADEVPH
ncbi:VRR-NUC domain-containing protein [uncultured Endozoicomonas sp.]|uniref:VRR-NUC domain-containing protein n=1 Tax=uncultured Endozoicomonas sp. TaxID=432652 RepID=UPI00263729BC|nr:VRR-NUC domain-containing protein [uncultured Endozoicomonas sp.]